MSRGHHWWRALQALSVVIPLAFTSGLTAAERSAAELMDALMWNREPVGGPFALIDHTGQPRTDADFRGKLLVVYFGFTYCPDICPTDLQAIGLALDKLGPAGESVQPLFITVDPERDTPGHLAEYVALFHPRLIGLSGDREAIRKAAAAYKVFFAKAASAKPGEYTIDHTAFIYLIGPAGQYLGFLPPGTAPDRLAVVLGDHLRNSRPGYERGVPAKNH
jgi:cytochrome oxidase Cu insertion factor (SCO1/SenC/PrrC family)